MTGRSPVAVTIPLDEEGVHRGHMRVPHSSHRSAYGHIPIPIVVAKRGAGPTVLLTGGIHGDEYEGPLGLYDLIAEIETLDFGGRLIIVPSVNHSAFLAGLRTSPIDDLNLNRSFPGDPLGTVTEVVADYVSTVLVPLAGHVVDLHAGGSSLNYLPTLFAPNWEDPARRATTGRLIEAFDPPRVAYFDSVKSLDGVERVFGNVAEKNGSEFLTGEFGGGGTVSLDGIEVVGHGLKGLLAEIGILRGPPPRRHGDTRHLWIVDADLFAFAPTPGIFEPAFRLGDEVAAGALAGRIHDPHEPWRPATEVHFRAGGLALCVRTVTRVEAGDCLGHLARDVAPRNHL